MSTKRKPRRVSTGTVRRRPAVNESGPYYISSVRGPRRDLIIMTEKETAVWHDREWRTAPGWGA